MESLSKLDTIYKPRAPIVQLINDIKNPKEVADNFYIETSSSPDPTGRGLLDAGRPNLISNYIDTNNTDICCLIKGLDCNLVSDKINTVQSGKVGTTSVVTLKNNKKIVLKIIQIKPFAVYYTYPVNPHPIIESSCVGHSNKVAFLGTDVFTNEYILANLLSYIFKSSGLPSLSVEHITSSICQDSNLGITGASVIEHANFGSVAILPTTLSFEKYFQTIPVSLMKTDGLHHTRVFTKDTILNIAKQIVISYDYLNNFDFNHSDSKISNALVFDTPTSFEYKGLTVNSPFTVKISDFDKASITVNIPTSTQNGVDIALPPINSTKNSPGDMPDFVRFFNKSFIADAYFKLFPFCPTVGNINGESFYKTDTTFNHQLFAQSRHTGLPFYRSYDIYTFMVSFLMMPEVFYLVFNDAELQIKLWEPLWFPDDSSYMFVKIRDSVESNTDPSFNNVVSILSKIKLKCDISSSLIQTLQLPPILQSRLTS